MATTTVKPDGTVTVETGHAAKATWDGESVAGVLVKASDERRYTLTVAYPADRADVAVAADGHRDFASKAAVEDAAHNYLLKGGKVGLHHADGTEGAGQVVESYIWPAGDWATSAGYVVKAGDWLVGIVWDEPSWELVKAGKIGGVSMQGSARRRTPTAEAIAALRE
jgi:Putative phage serine protease XkdF